MAAPERQQTSGELAGEAWKTPGPGEIPAVPGIVRMLDAGVPWFRTGAELDVAWDRLWEAVTAVLTNGLPNDYESLVGVERALFGVYNAARWSLLQVPTAPMGGEHTPVTGGSIRRQLLRAETHMVSRQEGWEYATGIVTWILWVTGAREDLVLPGEDIPPAV
jgi:hypothetical protein